MPYDHTSDLMVNLPYSAASGAVHFMGNFAPMNTERWRLSRRIFGQNHGTSLKSVATAPLHRTQQLSWICYKWLHYSSFSILLKIKFLTQFKIWSFVCVSGLVSMQFGFSNRCIWNKCAYFAFSFQPSPSSYRCLKYLASAQTSAAVYTSTITSKINI